MRDLKYFWLGFLILVTLSVIITIIHPISQILAYTVIISCFICSVITADRGHSSSSIMMTILSTGALLFVVVDPSEAGLFGYDSYRTLRDARQFTTMTIGEFIDDTLAFPGFYAYINLVQILLGAEWTDIGKYWGLTTVAFPFLYYVVFNRRVPSDWAAICAAGVGSIQTLFYFETKFVDEQLAVLLFPLILFGVVNRKLPSRMLAILGFVSVALIHHASSVIIGSAIVVISILQSVDFPELTRIFRFRDEPAQQDWIFISAFLVILTSAFIFVAIDFTQILIIGILDSSALSTASVAGNTGTTSVVSLLSSIGGRIATAGLGLVALYTVLSPTKGHWEFAWAVFGGGILGLFGVLVLGSNPVNLAPIRMYVFFIPILLAVVAAVGDRSGHNARTVLSMLVVMFIITQIFAVPSHALLTDPSTGTIDGGHYTSDELAAAEWVAEFGNKPVRGYELELWSIVGDAEVQDATRTDCQQSIQVFRDEVPGQNVAQASVYYSSGNTSLANCA